MVENPPLVTVIMPVRNEADFIAQSLGAVLAQDYPADRYEVLVVDGQSEDVTVAIARSVADHRVRILTNPGRIASTALNTGLDAAHGDIIVRVDGHTIIAPDYIRQCVRYLRETGADNVGGPLRVTGITLAGKAIASAHHSPFFVPSRYRISDQPGYADMVYLGAWPREVFDRVGRFNEQLVANQDYEFNYRIRKAGGRSYLTPDIRSQYFGRQTLGELWQQFLAYGRWKFRMLSQHPASLRPRQMAPPALVVTLVGGALLAPLSRRLAWLWRLAVSAYAAVTIIASVLQAARDGWRLLPRLPAVFTCAHVAWGSGFLMELIKGLFTREGSRRREPHQ